MCLCVKGKPKQKQSQLPKPQRPSIRHYKIPKSTVKFQAEDYQPKVFDDRNQFTLAKQANAYAQSVLERDSHYFQQAVNVKQSKLIKPKQLLTYDLDGKDGVSKVPVINTFHYSSSLNHLFTGYPKSPKNDHNLNNQRNSRTQGLTPQNNQDSKNNHPLQNRPRMNFT